MIASARRRAGSARATRRQTRPIACDAMSRSRLAVLTAIVLVVGLLAGCGDDDERDDERSGGDGDRRVRDGGAAGAEGRQLDAPERVLEPGEKATATFETSAATFVARARHGDGPEDGELVRLPRRGGRLRRHLVPPHRHRAFIQGGDPPGTGPAAPGYTVTEPPPADTYYLQGVVAMAKTAVEPPGRLGQPVLHRRPGRRRAARPTTRSSARSSRASTSWSGSPRSATRRAGRRARRRPRS